MTIQIAPKRHLTIEWDDGVVLVFSFDGVDGTTFCGFNHLIPAVQVAFGTQKEIGDKVTVMTNAAVQATGDPQTWVETAKFATRGSEVATIVYDDSTSVIYTTQTNKSFQLQLLHSLCG